MFLAILIYVIGFRVKGYVRIGGSLMLGISIILGALYVREHANDTETAKGTVTAVRDAKQPITTPDSDGDGVYDWEENLTAQVFKTIDTPQTTNALAANTEEYVPPTTFTGKFAEAFFQDYMAGKAKNDGNTDTTLLVNNAVKAIEANTETKTYSRSDLTIIPNSTDALRTYGNDITRIVRDKSVEGRNEALILEEALISNNKEVLEKLTPIRAAYESTLTDSRRVAVPERMVEHHLALLNTYEALYTDIVAMEQAFSDPLYTLARIKRYQEDAAGLFYAFKNISDVLRADGITYGTGDPGTFFYELGV